MFERIFDRLADEKEAEGALESGLQGTFGALAPIYGAGATVNRFLHESGLRQRQRLNVPVLSVGNMTLGGTGKTPFTIWLVQELKRQGRRPAVLTRGYRREDEERLVVVHNGRRLRAGTREAGDEPVLIGQALGDVPVIACSDRYRAGGLATRRFHADTIVLDDGFQHHRLDRDGDIVLLDAGTRLSSLRVFPRGTLREPAGALRRAHLVVMTRWDEGGEAAERAVRDVRREAPGMPLVRTRLKLSGFETLSGEAIPKPRMKGLRALLLCAVAQPKSVAWTARQAGMKIAGAVRRPDHERFTSEVLEHAARRREARGADCLLVTEKDAVKLREISEPPDHIVVMKVRLQMVEKKDAVRARKVIKARLQQRRTRGYLQ